MKKKTMSRTFIQGALYFLIFLILVSIMKNYTFQVHSDDAVYKNTFQEYSGWFDWAKDYYNNWSGRVAIHVLLISILNLPDLVWQILVSVTILVNLHYVIKIAMMLTGKKDFEFSTLQYFLLLAFSAILPIYFWHMFRDWTITWCTGSINYLLPGCCLFLSLYPVLAYFWNVPIKVHEYVIGLLAGGITSSSEQTGAIFLVFTTILYLFMLIQTKIEKINYKMALYCLSIDSLALISIFAPGNQVRIMMEISWFPAFPSLDWMDKFVLGMQHYTGHTHRMDTCLFMVMMYAILLILNRFNKRNCLFVLLGFLGEISITILCRTKFSEWYINPHWFLYLVWIIILVGVPLYNAWILYSTFSQKNKLLAIIVMLLYCAALSSCIVLGFTPTIYASGIRALYIYQLLMYALVIVLAYQVPIGENIEKRIFVKELVPTSCLVVSLMAVLGFAFLFYKTNQTTSVAITEMDTNVDIHVQDIQAIEKNGYLQVNMFVTDEKSELLYDNWVNGSGNTHYVNSRLFVKKGDEHYSLATYPKLNESNTGYTELRGYFPTTKGDDILDYQLGIVTYDLNNVCLGYKLLETVDNYMSK